MSSHDKEPSKPSGSWTGRIRTLSDLKGSPQTSSSRGPDDPQEYYTGGEKSGMMVQDPSKGYSVDRIFDQARRLGAVQRPLDDLPPSSSSRSFAGTGRLLSGATTPTPPQKPEPVVHNVVFWINGFTVNDGPLRRFDDPENAPFIESIMRSEVPKELEPADRTSPVPVNLIRRAENYPEPEAHRAPSFRGTGRTLGSKSSPATSVSTPLRNAPSSPSMGLVVDKSRPSTSIQLRLADGTRMVAHFNYHHTIADIRAFIDASRPGSSRSYQLQTVGFPPKVLTDATQTIREAGLLNSVVNQKL